MLVDRRNNHQKWKAVKGYWHGSFKDNGKGECGVVIKGADRESWVRTSRIAVPLKVISGIAVPLKSWPGYGSRSCRSVSAHRNP